MLLYLTMRFAKTIKQLQALQAYHAGDKLIVEVDVVQEVVLALLEVPHRPAVTLPLQQSLPSALTENWPSGVQAMQARGASSKVTQQSLPSPLMEASPVWVQAKQSPEALFRTSEQH